MTSKEIYGYLKEEKGVIKLYKLFEKAFQIIDNLSEVFIEGDLLNEYELSSALDKSTGVFTKLCPVVNGIESYMERLLQNAESGHYKTLDKVNAQAVSVAKADARASVSDVRDYLGDFKGYLSASQQMILSSQSRLKRLTVEKGAKGVDFTGDVNNVKEKPTVELPPDHITLGEKSITEDGWAT